MQQDFCDLANPSIRTLTPYKPGKPIEELERELGISGSIKLASNENPLGPSPKAIAAAKLALETAHIYPDGAYFELKQMLAKKHNVLSAQITVGNGSENTLELICKSYLSAGDSAVISQHAFLTIPILIKSYGGIIKQAKAVNWGHNVDNMLLAVDGKTRLLFLVNPNNPTGTYTNRTDLLKLLDNIPSHIIVVLDEAYHEYINKADYADTIALLNQYPNIIISRTFSKAYGLAALRVGYTISSPEIADILNRARLPFNVNQIAVKAACAALQDNDHIRKTIELNNAGMQQLETGLTSAAIDYIPSLGNFITINVGDGPKVYERLLHEGVIVRPLTAYEMPAHIRVTIGTESENQRFLTSLQKIMAATRS